MNGILTGLTVLTNLSIAMQGISTLLQIAQAEGRDLTAEELNKIMADNDQSFADLRAAIEKRKAEEAQG